MPRKPRIHFDGALYHVICRGNQRQQIFKDDQDRQRYLDLLKEAQGRFGFKLYAYVLMGNHVHHLIEIARSPLSAVMHNVLFRYTRYWNARHRKVGHLFQGRYKAILCEKESYLLELIRYLHLNPVRSRIVKDPDHYSWSSHRAYLSGAGRGWIAVDKALPFWGQNRARAVSAYRRFVRDGLGQGHREEMYEVVEQRYLGDERFVEEIERRVSDDKPSQLVEIEWPEIRDRVCREFGMAVSAVLRRSRKRHDVRVRRVMAWVGRELGGFTIQRMAQQLGQDATVLGRGLGRLAQQLDEDAKLRRVVESLCNDLRKGRKPKRSITHA